MVLVVIEKSVGRNGKNLAPDVVKIGAALVTVGPDRGGIFAPPLTLEGLGQAIEMFQKFQRLPARDGRVDPGGATLRRINEILNPGAIPPKPEILDTWFVTSFSGRSESVVVMLGYSAMTGNITFQRADGTKYSGTIGLFGLSTGLSLDPGKLPGMATVLKRYPALLQWLGGGAPLATDLLKWAIQPGILQRIITLTPGGMQIFNALKELLAGGSVAPDWAPSRAIGMVFPFAPPLSTTSFYGSCLCYSLTGTIALGNFGTYILFFGYRGNMYSRDFSLSNFKGCAIISAGGGQLQFPGLAATGTLFVGEIT